MCHRCDKKKQTPVKGAFHKGRLGHETSAVHRCDKNRCGKKEPSRAGRLYKRLFEDCKN